MREGVEDEREVIADSKAWTIVERKRNVTI